jgi:putative NADH-flavin reductase
MTRAGPSKSIALIGATGGTGSAILRHAVSRGHSIHALVRNEAKLRSQLPDDVSARVRALTGDATREADVHRLLGESTPDVLVLAVGTSSLEKNTICFDSGVALVRAACKAFYAGERSRLRVITVSGGGLGAKPGFVMEKILVPALLKEPLFDALQMEAALKTAPAEVLDAVIVRPYRLTDGEATEHWTVVPEDYKAPFVLRYTTRADVAQCVVREAEEWKHGGSIVNVFTGGG